MLSPWFRHTAVTLHVSSVTVFVLALGALAVPRAAATTIDFETPDLGDLSTQIISQYVASGVSFTAPYPCTGSALGLRKQTTLTGCTNQVLRTGLSRLIPRGLQIRADFPPEPATPVTLVSVEVQVLSESPVYLSLHNAAGTQIASASGVAAPGYGACGNEETLATVGAVASERVAYVIIDASFPDGHQCGAVDQCSPCAPGFSIDNFTFGAPDTEPPTLTLTVSPQLLWPPNHSLVRVQASVSAHDDQDESPQLILTSIMSDEPDEGTSDEDLPSDIQGADAGAADFEFHLRAERAEWGDGRAYTVCYEARDASGNVAQQCTVVDVPHDRRGQALLARSEASETLGARVWSVAGQAHATLAYTLPRPGHVRLRVFDVTGRYVESLVDGWRQAGKYSASLSRTTRSQVVLYRLEWEGKSTTGKVVVVR